MSLVNEEDLMVLCSKLKQFQSGVHSSNVGSAKSAVEQHCKGQEHLRKVQRKIDGSDRGTKIIESIQAYKDIVKDSTGGQEAVGFERVALNLQVHQQLYNINYVLPNYSV